MSHYVLIPLQWERNATRLASMGAGTALTRGGEGAHPRASGPFRYLRALALGPARVF